MSDFPELPPLEVTISFTRPKKFFKPLSWLIRVFDGLPGLPVKYSHVALEWTCASLHMPIAYHASGANVHPINGNLFEPQIERTHQYKFVIEGDEIEKHARFYHKYTGTSYGQLQILGILLTKLKLTKSNPFTDGTRSQVCSEVVGNWLLEVKGIDIGSSLDEAGPKKIDEVLRKLTEEGHCIKI